MKPFLVKQIHLELTSPASIRPKAGMMCGTAENRAEGLEGNGGSLPKWCEKAGS